MFTRETERTVISATGFCSGNPSATGFAGEGFIDVGKSSSHKCQLTFFKSFNGWLFCDLLTCSMTIVVGIEMLKKKHNNSVHWTFCDCGCGGLVSAKNLKPLLNSVEP